MAIDLPHIDDAQRAVLAEFVQGVGSNGYDALHPMLDVARRNRVWVTPPLIAVAAGLVRVITEGLAERPWCPSDDPSDEYPPEQRPSRRTEWNKSTLALHAAASLAGGVWLDVGTTESYWQMPRSRRRSTWSSCSPASRSTAARSLRLTS